MRRMQNCQRTLISLSQLLLILRLGVTACKSGNSPPSVSQEHPLRLPGKPCLDEDQNYGLVFGGSCCFQEWICDGYSDQPGCEENLDEGEEPGQGCNLFPESGCRSSNGKNHFKCERLESALRKKKMPSPVKSEERSVLNAQTENGSVRVAGAFLIVSYAMVSQTVGS